MVVLFTGASPFPAPSAQVAEVANCDLQGSAAAPVRQGRLAAWPNSPKTEIAGNSGWSGSQGRCVERQVKAKRSRKHEGRPQAGRPSKKLECEPDQTVRLEDLVTKTHFLNPLPLSLKPTTLCAASWELPNCWELCSTGWPKVVHLREILCRNAVNDPETHA